MPVPDFSPGEVLTAAAMDSIGLWLVDSGPLSGAATNFEGCFTSKYRNYRIEVSDVTQTVGYCAFRFLQGSTAVTASNYVFSFTGRTSAGVTAFDQSNSISYGVIGFVVQSTADGALSGSYDIFSPQQAKITYTVGSHFTLNAGVSFNFYAGGSAYNGNDVFDGIQFLTTGSGSQAGNVRIYGYRD
jgi:hypothetical protein